MAKRLTNEQLKALYLKGTVYVEERQIFGFDAMVFEHKCGNTLSIHTGDEIIEVTAPMPRWMVVGLLVSAPTILWALDSALSIAGF